MCSEGYEGGERGHEGWWVGERKGGFSLHDVN